MSDIPESADATRILMHVDGIPIYYDGARVWFTAGMTIDADGCPVTYHPDGSPPGLDYLANAGHPGNWWALATDNGEPSGHPLIQRHVDPAPGFYISMTSYHRTGYAYRDPNRYLNSARTPFIVIPGKLIHAIPPVFMGCQCQVTNLESGQGPEPAVCGDAGPNDHLGEASMATAEKMGLSHNPKHGGTEKHIILYELFPGVPAMIDGEEFPLQPSGS